MPSPTSFKICGLTRPVDAAAAVESGATYVGAVLVESSPRRVSPPQAAGLASAVGVPLVIVTADLGVEGAEKAAEEAGAGGIQLHGGESPEEITELRERGSWELWKAVRVRTPDDLLAALERFGPLIDLLLVDAWHPDRIGGTGVPLDWESLARVRERMPSGLRFGIAGGLAPENVAEAIATLRPDLVDVSSGVEASPGVKDHERVRAFARAVRAAEGVGSHG